MTAAVRSRLLGALIRGAPIRGALGALIVGAMILGALAVALPPTAARASSLVFVKSDGNVWLAGPDGHDQLQVTSDGSAANAYFSPSQSANGSIEVARGTGSRGRIYRLGRDGAQLSPPFAVAQVPAIVDPLISADGRRVAFWTASLSAVSAPCYTNFFCFEVSYPNRFNQLIRPAWMTFEHPAWMGSSRLLLFNGGATLNYADLSGHGFSPWFSWSDFHNAATDGLGEWLEGAVSSSGRELALLTHIDNRRSFVIQLFSGPDDVASADLGAYKPAPWGCQIAAPDGSNGAQMGNPNASAFSSISFSPGASAVAYEFKGSTYIASIETCAAHKIIAGGHDPFWGPANVVPPHLSIGVSPHASIRGLLHGLRVTLRLGNPGAVTLSLTQGHGRLLARARVALIARRTQTVVLKPSSAVARGLTNAKQLEVKLTATLAGFSRPLETGRLRLFR